MIVPTRGQPRLRRLGWSDEWDARYRMATTTGGSPATPADRVADGHLTQSTAESGDARHRGSPGGIRAIDGGELSAARVARLDATGCACLSATGPVRTTVEHPLEPVAGDWALLAGDRLVGLLPRATTVHRAQGHRDVRGEVVAANVDAVLIVQAVPTFAGPVATERLLALAAASGARPVLVLSQADLAADPAELAAALAELTIHAQPHGACPGVEVVVVSTVSGQGLDRLRELIGTGTGAVLGPPRSGKSALVDAVSGTRMVPSRAGSTLVPLPGGGALIDTPGRPPGDWLAQRYATRLRVERQTKWQAAAAAAALVRRRGRRAAGGA
jgi:voltage-gated potassium channel Kch